MRHFISQVADGHTKMTSLINRDQTRQQIHQSEMRVKNSINAAQVEADLEAKRNRFLQSLKFESMNARRTDIKIASEATYVSFFKSLKFTKEPTSGSAAAAWANFVAWLQSDEQAFWIQGKPGAGKSTLVKFLLQHENTSKALNKWNHNPLIVSHFFWKPGSKLQRNFIGLLCSINHQLLSDEPGLVDQILSEFKSTKENDTIVDWEIPDLVDMFRFTLTHYKRSIFFLIDGIDEAVDTEDILKFLTSSITLRNTKWCISSRGEEIFQQTFSKYKGFKLNEYTRDDMLNFAQKEIQYELINVQGYENIYKKDFLATLQCSLVDKAEGVYLWLVLALESIKRGLRNNDREGVILSRLVKLPTGLAELYRDMWDRLGEDQDIYQKEAASYFNLLITHRTLTEEYNEIFDQGYPFSRPLTVLQIMFAQENELQLKFLDASYEPQLSELEEKCLYMAKSISIKTAGLLVTQERSKFSSSSKLKAEYSQLDKYATREIEFIHRTLFDFLRDTQAGKTILSQAQADFVYAQLATTMLCRLRIQNTPTGPNHIRPIEGSLHYFRWFLNQLRKNNSLSNEKVFLTLLSTYETLFECSLIPWDRRPKGYPRPCFDILLLDDPVFNSFIKQRLESKGAPYASCVLRESMFISAKTVRRPNDLRIGVLDFLCKSGADINSTGACLYEPPGRVAINGQFATCFTCESPLSIMVKGLFNRTSYYKYSDQLSYLVAFLERSPNLYTPTSYLLATTEDKTYFRGSDWKLCPLLSALNTDETKVTDDHLERSNAPGSGKFRFAFIITEVNLKYLVEIFLQESSSYDTATNALKARAQQLTHLEGSKAYFKSRFIVTIETNGPLTLGGTTSRTVYSKACYKFINEDLDVFREFQKIEQKSQENPRTHAATKYLLKWEKVNEYIRACEEVDISALLILLKQNLGVCFGKPNE